MFCTIIVVLLLVVNMLSCKHMLLLNMATSFPVVSCLLLLLSCCLVGNAGTQSVDGKENKIHINFLFIAAKTGRFLSSAAIPAVDLALEEINNSTDILPDYVLEYTIADSKCDGSTALEAFTSRVTSSEQSSTTYLALLGCGCSTATIPVAHISHYWNIPHMSFTTTLDMVNDHRLSMPGFFHTLPSRKHTALALDTVLSEFEWRRAVIITGKDSLYTDITRQLRELVAQRSVTLEEVNGDDDEDLFNWDGRFRIIIVNTSPERARYILCRAHDMSMLPPEYVWITPGWYPEHWWMEEASLNCSLDARRRILNLSLSVVPEGSFVSSNSTLTASSGTTPETFKEQYALKLKDTEYKEDLNTAGVAYDAIWSLARGLHRTTELISGNNSDSECSNFTGELVPLEEFDYQNNLMGCVLRRSVSESNFVGITGPVSFNRNGSRNFDHILIRQYRVSKENLTRATVGQVSLDGLFEFINSSLLWEEGVPDDRPPTEPLGIPLISVYYVMATIGLVYAATCFVFNTAFRNRKVVRLSSPNLNYFVILGSAILYVCIYFYTFNEENENLAPIVTTIICNVRANLITLGYGLCFAVIVSKTWRVYYIFNNPRPGKKTKMIQDPVLLVAVLVIVAIDMLIVIIGTAVPFTRFNSTLRYRDHHDIYICTNSYSSIWLAISFGYKVLLQIVSLFMAFRTRKVTIKALNDSKQIALLVYITTFELVVLAVIAFGLREWHIVYRAVFGGAMFIAATVYLSVVFIPRMIDLYRDPNGDNVLSSTVRKSSQIYSFQVKEDVKEDIPVAVKIHSVKKKNNVLGSSEASNVTASRENHNLSAESS